MTQAPERKTTRHEIGVARDMTTSDGNMWTRIPVCACGWRVSPVADYNDDQIEQVRRQGDAHLREVERVQ